MGMIWTPWYISFDSWILRNWCKVYPWLFWSHLITLDILYGMFDFISAYWIRYLNWSSMNLSVWYECRPLILLWQKLKPSVIPAVEVEPPGCSFNPSVESHQVILWYFIRTLPIPGSCKSHGILICSSFVNSGCVGSCCCRRNAESLSEWVGT